jgi:2-polyprenyl-6-methoxyphenol hydroxylase-like FAD-dependent oxidoreductase
MKSTFFVFIFAGCISTAADVPTQPLAPRAEEPSITYDLVVIGGTPGGIACAVRAAREGASVLLVNRHEHLGGLLSSGIGVWDTQFEGKRSPIYDEVRRAIMEDYRTTYGADSQQYREALPGPSGYTNGRFEPPVAEKIINDLVAREKNIAVMRGFIPAAVERGGAVLKSLTLHGVKDGVDRTVQAHIFADCTYEGDLAAQFLLFDLK